MNFQLPGKIHVPTIAFEKLSQQVSSICFYRIRRCAYWPSVFRIEFFEHKVGALRPTNELCRQPAHRNQHNHVNPVVPARSIATKVIAEHEHNHGHGHKGVLL